MLRVKPQDRANATELLDILEEMHQKGCASRSYVASPQPGYRTTVTNLEMWFVDELYPPTRGASPDLGCAIISQNDI